MEILTDKRSKIQPFHLFLWQKKAENTTQKESQAKDNSQRRQPKMCKHSYVVIQSDRRLPQTLQATQIQMPWLLPKRQAFTWNFNAEVTAPQASVVLLAVESLVLEGVV